LDASVPAIAALAAGISARSFGGGNGNKNGKNSLFDLPPPLKKKTDINQLPQSGGLAPPLTLSHGSESC
jgi:hypothetical protein